MFEKELTALIDELKIIGTRFDASPAQVAAAWAIAKGTLPIIGVTKVRQVEDAAKAAQIELTVDEISRLERLGDETGVQELAPCSIMKEGQIFYADRARPEGFCDGAWRSIYQYVFALANGGGKEGFFYNDWAKEPGAAISCCNDGFRPVILKLEATDEEI